MGGYFDADFKATGCKVGIGLIWLKAGSTGDLL
jgi:hypothetical protein